MTTAPAPIINPIPIPPDTRSIAEMPFDGGDETRALLARCSVTEAREIELLGCTGATKFGLSVDEIRALRLGLAGGGVGLPCFVDPGRYCLAHNTIGGLQHEQRQRYPEFADQISRPLTESEAGHVAFTEAVRHSANASDSAGGRIAAASSMLNGYGDMPRGAEMVEEETGIEPHHLSPGAAPPPDRTFACPEHTSLVWTCRFCVAQAIANGELDTVFAIRAGDDDVRTRIVGNELVETVGALDAAGAAEVEIYVLTKTLTRRLA